MDSFVSRVVPGTTIARGFHAGVIVSLVGPTDVDADDTISRRVFSPESCYRQVVAARTRLDGGRGGPGVR
jgi:hypothetical protein